MCIHKHVELEKSYAMILNIPRTLFYTHVRCAFHVTSRYFLNDIMYMFMYTGVYVS